jgi:DNA-binding response OmpR family regulator
MKSVTTILFVENDAVALTMYQKRLQREGFHVEIAEDGIAALKVLSEMTPDLVVLDLMLPKFSGRDVFDYMRADAQFKDVPVIIFSNAAKTEWPRDIELSPTRALPKSEANFAALLELVREMTGTASAKKTNMPAPAASLPEMAAPESAAPSEMEMADAAGGPQTAEEFLQYAIADMPMVREHCLAFIKGPSTENGRNNLLALRKRLSLLNAGAKRTGCARLGLLANAWEALLAEIERKPAVISPSILQTLAQAADCLRILLNNNAVSPLEPLPQARVLSVDDDEICNDVAVSALQRANMDADSSQDANAALEKLQTTDYDLVLLDINMPVLTGFEVCEKLRGLPHHEKTPVIFVTAFNNFENRKQSVLSGGGDLIAKPVSPLELALKVTIHLLKAPPKPVTAMANGGTEAALVWKEPTEVISHDTEMFLRGVKNLNATPNLVAPTTETRTSDPEAEVVAKTPEPIKMPEEKLEPVAIPANAAMLELGTKTIEANVLESIAKARSVVDVPPAIKMPGMVPMIEPALPASNERPAVEELTPTIPVAREMPTVAEPAIPASENIPAAEPVAKAIEPAIEIVEPLAKAPEPIAKATEPEPVSEPVAPIENKILEEPAPSAVSNERTVAPPQPQPSSEPLPPTPNGGSKKSEPMSKENNSQFETLVQDVAQIIFGDNAPDINVRLVRMALEQVWKNRSELQTIDAIAREIARIIFGETNTSDLNVRLVKMALERSNSIALFKAA